MTKIEFSPIYPLSILLAGAVLSACGEEDVPPAPGDSGVIDTGTADTGVRDTGVVDSGIVETLYDRLGGNTGIEGVVGRFISRVIADPKINGYFLNSSVDGNRLVTCLTKQIGSLTGGPQTYPGPGAPADNDGCRNMAEAHGGLGISQLDFSDLAGHLSAELTQSQVAAADIATIVAAITPLSDVIVERPNDNEQIYNRIGRKPAVQVVITDFLGRVVADPKINGYFLNNTLNANRLGGCLVRQVCGAVGGPCKYGEEMEAALFDKDADGTVEAAEICASMTAVHSGLGISAVDFDDLVAHLAAALTAASVAPADIATIAGVLTAQPLKDQIIENPLNNENIYQRAGRKPAIQTVITGFLGRVLADPKINGYFLNNTLSAARLSTCLVRQVCAVTGGPCGYGLEVEAEIDRDADGTVEPTEVCQDMMSVHDNLGISRQDFDDLVGHLVAELTAAGVASQDIMTIGAVLTAQPLVDQIVENPLNNENIYQRIGRKPAIQGVITDFLGRVLADPKINGYFLNNTVSGARLGTCLVRQVCGLTGGPCRYGLEVEAEIDRDVDGTVEPNEVCQDMTSVHAGLGISQVDYTDLAGHLVDALTTAAVPGADITTITGVLTDPPFVATIVTDATSDATVYQRVGRKPAITSVVSDFLGRVTSDNTLVGFFDNLTVRQVNRLRTCVVRQVCGIDGPCDYGLEVFESTLDVNNNTMLDANEVCRDMMTAHAAVVNSTGGAGISIADFNAFLGHLSMALTMAGVDNLDRDAVLNTLDGMCPMIVAGGTGC